MGAISQASASAAANAGAVDRGHASESLPRTGGRGEQRSSLGQLLLQFPLPVATSADVVAMKLAYYKKMIDGLRDFDCTEYLSRVGGGNSECGIRSTRISYGSDVLCDISSRVRSSKGACRFVL